MTKVDYRKHFVPGAKTAIRAAIRNIKRFPDAFNMQFWCNTANQDKAFNPKTYDCGTTVCFAGEVALNAGFTPGQLVALEQNKTVRLPAELRQLVPSKEVYGHYISAGEITNRILFGKLWLEFDTDTIYMASKWPEPFHTQYNRAKGKEEEAEVAIRRFTHLLETGE